MNVNKYTCQKCNKEFRDEPALKQHTKAKHDEHDKPDKHEGVEPDAQVGGITVSIAWVLVVIQIIATMLLFLYLAKAYRDDLILLLFPHILICWVSTVVSSIVNSLLTYKMVVSQCGKKLKKQILESTVMPALTSITVFLSIVGVFYGISLVRGKIKGWNKYRIYQLVSSQGSLTSLRGTRPLGVSLIVAATVFPTFITLVVVYVMIPS